MPYSIAVLLFGVMLTGSLSAQRVEGSGIIVRTIEGDRHTRGAFAGRRGDSLVVVVDDGAPRAVPIGPDTRVQLLAGRSSAALPGFVVGFLVGGTVGGVGVASLCESLTIGGGNTDCTGSAVGGTVVGGTVFGLLGLGVGALIRSERWLDVSPDSIGLVSAGSSPAQRVEDSVQVERGVRARIYTARKFVEGRLVGLSPEALSLSQGGRVSRLPREDVVEVRVRAGRRWAKLLPEQVPMSWPPLEGPIAAGVMVRAIEGDRQTRGAFMDWRGDSLMLAVDNGALRGVPIGPETRIQVVARRTNAALPGFIVGFALGGGLGAAGASGLCGSVSWGSDDSCGSAALGGALMGGTMFGILGLALGAAAQNEVWTDVPADSVRAFLARRH